MPYCVLCITNKCSLKCRHCAAFITQYKEHADYSFQYVKTVFGRFLQVVDSIQELELMGGEPFLCSEFNDILRWCIEQKKIEAVKIITNGTIMPKEDTWELLKNEKVKLVIDDYGALSNKCREIARLAEKYLVRHEVQKLQTWYQLEPIFDRGYSEGKKAEIFQECTFRTCIGITNGRLYHCNVAGHMNTVGMLEDAQSNFIQLENQEWEDGELKDRVKEFLSIPYLEACGWCNYSAHVEIQAAAQR